MYQTLPYNPIEDFTFISTTAEYPLVLVTHPDSELRSVADIVSVARSRSAPLLYGTAGNGSLMHLTMELFAKKANIRLQHVPYKGGLRRRSTDLLGKRVDLVLDPPTVPLPFVKDSKLRALAVTGAESFLRAAESSNDDRVRLCRIRRHWLSGRRRARRLARRGHREDERSACRGPYRSRGRREVEGRRQRPEPVKPAGI